MKKIVSLLLVVLMVLGCVGLVACGGGGGGGEGATTANGGSESANGNGDGNGGGNGEEESLGDILGLGEGIEAVEYDMVMTVPGVPTMTQHWWVKQNKARIEMTEQGQMIVYLADYDDGTAYMYMPDLNMAYKIDISQVTQGDYKDVQSITDYDYHEIGTDTIDGKECLVVEYTDPASQVTVKAWIWKEHGFPIRTEATTAEGTAIVEFKNIEFGDISDDMFELPAGVEIMQMPGS